MAVGIPNFPTSLDAASDLVEATNNASTTINMVGGLSNSATTITVVSTAAFPSTGIIRIDDELISYSAKTNTTFTVQTRGFESSTAASHIDGATVSLDITAASNNAKNTAIIALETKIGTGSSTPTANTVLRGTGTGTSAFGQVGLTTDVTGTLPVANGGTGVTTSTGSGSTVLSTSPTLTTPNLGTPSTVTLTNATGLPLSTGVTGTLPVANGGTGNTTPYTAGQLLIGNNAGGLTKATLTAGSNVTITNGDGAITIAATGGSSGVTSFSAGTTGLTPTSNTTGAVTLSGTLGVANGGTGASSLTANNVLLGNGTGAVQVVAPGTSGNVLTSNGTTWSSQPGTFGIVRTNGSISLNASSPPEVFLTDNTLNSQGVFLPDVTAAGFTVGRRFTITNESAAAGQLLTFGSGLLLSYIARGQRVVATCISTANNNASSWYIAYDNFLINPAGAENYLINSAFRVDQRLGGASRTVTTGSFQFVADRWQAQALGASVSVAATALTGLGGLRITGAASNTGTRLRQRIEQRIINNLSDDQTGNRTVTLSFEYAVAGAGAAGVSTTFSYAINYASSGDNFSTTTSGPTGNMISQPVSNSPVVRMVSSPISIASTAGIELIITLPALTAAQDITIRNIKLEPGPVPTPYVSVPYDVELQRCQRYFYSLTPVTNDSAVAAGLVHSATTVLGTLSFPPMRVPPTATVTNPTACDVAINNGIYGGTFSVANTTVQTTQVAVQGSYDWFIGLGALIRMDVGLVLSLSAEL